jgi:hypothetical protein
MGGKKSSGKTYTSKGERKNVSSSLLNGIRADRPGAEDMLNKQRAWVAGSNPWVTIANPSKEQTNKRFIRVRYNDLMHGSYKELEKRNFGGSGN